MEKKLSDWKNIEKRVLPLFREEIKLMEDMAKSTVAPYVMRHKLYQFRQVCLGYLLITKNNAQATIRLIKANLVHQIHYISRNTFEMVVTLYYIDNNKSQKDILTGRYFDYSKVQAYEAMKMINEYPEIFGGIGNEERDKQIQKGYDDFVSRYKTGDKKLNLKTWSGKNLRQMIEDITDDEIKIDLLHRYRLMVRLNCTNLEKR